MKKPKRVVLDKCEACDKPSSNRYGCSSCAKMIGECCYNAEACPSCGSPMEEGV